MNIYLYHFIKLVFNYISLIHSSYLQIINFSIVAYNEANFAIILSPKYLVNIKVTIIFRSIKYM